MKYLKFKYFILILTSFPIFMVSCSIHPQINNEMENPRLFDRNYSFNELKESNPEYYDKFSSALNLYEKFKNSITDSLINYETLFIDDAQNKKEFFIENLTDINSLMIGLESIEIDTLYYLYSDTIQIKKPYIYFLNIPIPLLNSKVNEFKPIGPIENFFLINCGLGFSHVNRSSFNAQTYKITLHTKLQNQKLFINMIDIHEQEGLDYKLPFILRPFIWFKN